MSTVVVTYYVTATVDIVSSEKGFYLHARRAKILHAGK